MPPLLKYIIWPLCIYTVYCGLLFFFQRQIMFPRGMIPQPSPSAPNLPGLEIIWLETESGQVECWLLPPVPGSAAVCALSVKRPSAALVLMSTFTSARSFARRYLAPSFLVRDPLDNLAAVEKYKGPILIMHGRHDTVIPYSHGAALRQAARSGKLIAYEAGHNDCPPDWNVFWKDIEAFFRSNGII